MVPWCFYSILFSYKSLWPIPCCQLTASRKYQRLPHFCNNLPQQKTFCTRTSRFRVVWSVTVRLTVGEVKGTQIFQKSWSHLKILGLWRVTWNKFHTEDQKLPIRQTVRTFFARASWRPGFMRPWVSNKTLTRSAVCQSCWSVSVVVLSGVCIEDGYSIVVAIHSTLTWARLLRSHFDAHRDALILILSVCRILVLFLCTNLGLARVSTLIAGITLGFCF